MTRGHRYFVATLAQLSEDELLGPSALPGWTRRHILSHLGHNARALGRLAHWAATGEPTPMYRSPTARAEEIELGASWDAERLRSFVEVEQEALATTLEKLDLDQWATEVVTAQGRHVSATELPWLRTRELWIHATDLGGDADFSSFPPEMLDELIADVLRLRQSRGEIVNVRPTDQDVYKQLDDAAPMLSVEGPTADIARWLTGRGASNIQTSDGSALPMLGPWL